MREEIFTHPNNKRLLLEAVKCESVDEITALCGTPIRFTRNMPERRIEEVWHPTSWGPFCELTPSDEAWARPLGLGRIDRVDRGPLIVMMRSPQIFADFRFSTQHILQTKSILYETCQ